MERTDELTRVVAQLSDEQLASLTDLARTMTERPFYETAPPDALASLQRGLAQLKRGETVTLDELDARLRTASKPAP